MKESVKLKIVNWVGKMLGVSKQQIQISPPNQMKPNFIVEDRKQIKELVFEDVLSRWDAKFNIEPVISKHLAAEIVKSGAIEVNFEKINDDNYRVRAGVFLAINR